MDTPASASEGQLPFPQSSRRIRQPQSRSSNLRILLLALFALILSGCSPNKPPRIADFRSLGELRVATRLDAISYRIDEDGRPSGFEHDLLQRLGADLGVPVRFVVYPDSARALDAVLNGEAHLAAAGLGLNDRFPLKWSAPLREVDYVLVSRTDAPEIDKESELTGRAITVRRGALSADTVEQIQKRVPSLTMHLQAKVDDQTLLAQLAEGKHDLVATDRVHFALAAQLYPSLTVAYDLPLKSHIAWALPLEPNDPLATEVQAFLDEARETSLLSRIADRYFGHVRRLDEADISTFFSRIQERLPALRQHFHDAQAKTGIDWRYLAALAYQESHWDAYAISPTGVRGLMMLTADTADRLGVSDRLDARQSILGGARYFSMLKEQLPDEIEDPDRQWLATAAYNLGMGHMNGARAIARGMGRDSASWWDMKAVLPLLSRPQYAARLKSGAARGGEAVIMTENIRNFYDILVRLEPAYEPALTPPKLRLSQRH